MDESSEQSQGAVAEGAPRWDLTGIGSAYCNIATATATRDAVLINLGLSQRASAELKSELLQRILLSPRTATHLHRILGTLLAEYQAQRGEQR